MAADGLQLSVEKMRADGVPDAAIDVFTQNYERLVAGERGMVPEAEIEPVESLADFEDLSEDTGTKTLDRTVVIKLNGGLGTSMGMTKAKSLLEVKDGLTFLDIIARQVLHVRERSGARLPLVLMNSFRTREDSLELLEGYPELRSDVPLDFLQGKVPKLRADDLTPVSWPDDPSLEWAPPGHGDVYTSLVSSGMLDELIAKGYEYAFISNADNLGAVLEPRILSWFAREELPFAMEVADRTAADRKGGHLARRPDGGLVLRETAQTPDEDMEAFQDTSRHRYFNTNTLWLNLRALADLLEQRRGVLGLPMIVNKKTVDPSDKSSPEVFQLETAMGSAVDVIKGAAAIRVPRRRFAPVKTTSDLLAVRSDAYRLNAAYEIELVKERGDNPPIVSLDDHFKLLKDFEERFPSGPPSLAACDSLTVTGDVEFGANVTVHGDVTIEHRGPDRLRIEDGTVLDG